MDLHLQHVRTGDTYKLTPERTLIGSADHATVKTAAEEPFLAALAVRYPSGWTLYGLTDDPEVTFNRQPLGAVQRVRPTKGNMLVVKGERFTFVAPGDAAPEPPEPVAPLPCFAYIKNPDGLEECRTVDHDLLFGRMAICHVQLADSRLSRLSALLACDDDGVWYIHNLSKKPLGRNRRAVHQSARVENGDELLIGPLVVRLEIRSGTGAPVTGSHSDPSARTPRPGAPVPAPGAGPTGVAERTDDGAGAVTESEAPDLTAVRGRAEQLENWLKGQEPAPRAARSGLGGWLENQRDRLRRFWLDTPETTSARSLRAAKKLAEAFSVLDRAIRHRPDSPELLRELYRLYEAVGFADLCFRPLRQIEKLAEVRGAPDPWVLEELARLCERLGPTRPAMFDRAVAYWTKLEAATGVSCSRQRSNALALRAIHERRAAGATGEE
jgi:hypothetical protein